MVSLTKKNIFYLFAVLVIVITVIFTLRFLIGGDEDTWICQKGEWIKHGNPAKPQPQILCKQ